MFIAGLIVTFTSLVLISASNVSNQKSDFTWETIKTESNAWLVSSNFTEGDKIALAVYPASDWYQFMEPAIPDVPFIHKFVFVNITDPHGNEATFEITYVREVGSSSLFVYNVSLPIPNGIGIQADENLQSRIMGKVMYTGQYVAKVVGGLPPGGSPPLELTLLKENELIVIEHPYVQYLYPAIVVFFMGIVLSFWSAKTRKHKVLAKRRASVKRYMFGSL